MKISYNWLKWYVPEIPEAEKLADIFTMHLCEVEDIEKKDDDSIFDLKILPDRAHDLLSHNGIARELAGQLGITFNDPTPKYKIPESKPTNLKIELQTENCRRYSGRIVRNIKVGPSPEWVKMHLESIGQRSINNIVDATNITMYDCGQPCHAFDLDKLVSEKLIVRYAKAGEKITTLDNKEVELKESDMVIADENNVLAIAGVKGGKIAEVDENTKNILIEVANFDPVSVRKTSRKMSIITDSSKRFENDLTPELCSFAMVELSGLLVEFGFTDFEDVVDIYKNKQQERKVTFSVSLVNQKLGADISADEIEKILKQHNYVYTRTGEDFEITPSAMRLDLNIPEDMVEEIGRVYGYDKVTPQAPKIDFIPSTNETFTKIMYARNKLLSEGYNEVMTYSFCNKGKVQVLASASDKKYLRENLNDGLKDSINLNNLNMPFLGLDAVKIFEIGTVFLKDMEEIHVAYGTKKEIKEMTLDEYCKDASPEIFSERSSDFLAMLGQTVSENTSGSTNQVFKMWSLYPFIARDIALWADENVSPESIQNIIKENAGELLVKEPRLFDTFKKEGKISYAFRLVFQSKDKTLTDEEVSIPMTKITEKLVSMGFEIR
ncbi:MAG: phenylalanine--tRNA ligase subunit beta [Patescibacteria group bacterium]